MTVVPSNRLPRLVAAGATLLVVVGAAACGGDDGGGGGDTPALSADAEAGQELARSKGCAGCHGNDFSGGLGPSWVGLYGSSVELEGGQTVTADDAYLARSIAEPNADRVAGFALEMPSNDLDDEEIAQVVAYIRALGDSSG